jgi:hypothetical protein
VPQLQQANKDFIPRATKHGSTDFRVREGPKEEETGWEKHLEQAG